MNLFATEINENTKVTTGGGTEYDIDTENKTIWGGPVCQIKKEYQSISVDTDGSLFVVLKSGSFFKTEPGILFEPALESDWEISLE